MLPLRLSVATRHLNIPLPQALRTVAEAGARAVQLEVRQEFKAGDFGESARSDFLHQLSEQLLSLSAFEFPTRRAFYDLEALDSRVAALKSAMDFAYSLKVKTVVGRLGRIPEDPKSAAFELLVQVMNDIARHANRCGATFAFTPTTDTPEVVQSLLSQVVEGPLGVNLDVGGLMMNGISPLTMYQQHYDRVLAVQVRDGLRDIDGQGQEVPLGRGEVAWDELLALLHEGGYRQWLTIMRSTGDDKIGDTVRAMHFLQRVALGQ